MGRNHAEIGEVRERIFEREAKLVRRLNGKMIMYSAPNSPVPTEVVDCAAEPAPITRREDLAYQVMTIGAIVTVLITVWVF